MARSSRRSVRGCEAVASASAAEDVSPSAIRSGRRSLTATWITCTGQAPVISPSTLARSSASDISLRPLSHPAFAGRQLPRARGSIRFQIPTREAGEVARRARAEMEGALGPLPFSTCAGRR